MHRAEGLPHLWRGRESQLALRGLGEPTQDTPQQSKRVALPGAIIKTSAELDQWLAGVRKQVEEKLKDGPVIL